MRPAHTPAWVLAAVLAAALVGCGTAQGPSAPSGAPTSPTSTKGSPGSTTSGPPTSPGAPPSGGTTTSPPVPPPSRGPTPTLGRSWAPAQQGYGTVRPTRISNGGDPTGLVERVRWSSWGGAQALATGRADYLGPNQIVADATMQPASVVAFDLGQCDGRLMYRKVTWYFPQHGQHFDAADAIDICTGQSG